MPTVFATEAVATFRCLGADCPDSCCQGWAMQVSDAMAARYAREAPSLYDALSGSEGSRVMRRDAAGRCVKLEGGWCGIQREHGAALLSDTCHFYPRVVRRLGEAVVISATLSCPEIARQAVTHPTYAQLQPLAVDRLPEQCKDYLPEGLSSAEAIAIHEAMLHYAMEEGRAAETSLLHLGTVARALDHLPAAQWAAAVPLYLTLAPGRVPIAESHPADLLYLLQYLYAMIGQSQDHRSLVQQWLMQAAHALGARIDGEGAIHLEEERVTKALAAVSRQRLRVSLQHAVLLQRYLVAQLSLHLFPFAGTGEQVTERLTLIGLRYACLGLIISTYPTESEAVDLLTIVQQFSRVSDHRPEDESLLRIATEAGWRREPRLRAILG